MARFYANENFPFPGVEELRALGHDVLTMSEAGHAGCGMPDEEVLEFARREGRTVLSLNRKHFIRLHEARPDHSGVVVCSFDPDFARLAVRIHEAIGTGGRLAGRLVRVNRPQM